ncbi:MAG: helix-turn-helix domain-containing protein [Verrucomicrobiaceae bacterium]|nr:helix-turn-helix domain-containing protein [Verrucomicrobiaceae bacterium]
MEAVLFRIAVINRQRWPARVSHSISKTRPWKRSAWRWIAHPRRRAFVGFALRWLYEGKSREQVADLSGFSLRQVLRFIQAFNLAGLDGLIPGVAAAVAESCPRNK